MWKSNVEQPALHENYEAAGVGVFIVTFVMMVCGIFALCLEILKYWNARSERKKSEKVAEEIASTTNAVAKDLRAAMGQLKTEFDNYKKLNEAARAEDKEEMTRLLKDIAAGKCSGKATATSGVGAPVESGTPANNLTTSSSSSATAVCRPAAGKAGSSNMKRRLSCKGKEKREEWHPPGVA